jgi:molecular chaperone HtpG
VSLADYVSRMRPGQEAIYYVTGDNTTSLRASPHIEGFVARGVEVLLLTDSIDEFWPAISQDYDGKPIRSVTRAGADLEKIAAPEGKDEAPAEKPPERETATLIALIRTVLGDAVQDVRASPTLIESAVRLVAAEGQPDINLEKLLRLHGQIQGATPHVLEINPGHKLLREMAARAATGGASDLLADRIWLLLDQARILEGSPVLDAAAFARRLAAVMEGGLGGL